MSNIPRNILAFTPAGRHTPVFSCVKSSEGFVFVLRDPTLPEDTPFTCRFVLDRFDTLTLARALVDDLMRYHD